MLNGFIVFWFQLLSDWGYLGIIVLMAMESSIFPVPSEVVMPPAAYWVSKGEMTFWGVVFAGTLGSWIGSAITYAVAKSLGRALVERYGKWFRITSAGIDRAERMIHRYEAGGIFFSRLLPVVRHLISIPAGLMRMNFKVFSLMTIVGSFLWCLILTEFSLRIFAKYPGDTLLADPNAMVHLIKQESLPLVAAIVAIAGLYLLVMKLTAPKATAQ
jgi:membrane protein DedA with SNARE-associated domain